MSLRNALLGLLVFRPGSGYDLLKMFDTSLGYVWPAKQSQIYGELTKLDATGLIKVTEEGPRGRKQYSLTPEGHAETVRWLTESRESRPQRNPMLLQTFFLGLLPRDEAVQRLLDHAEASAKEHDTLVALRDTEDWDKDMLTVCGRLVLEHGIRQRVLEQEWARWAADQLRAGHAVDPAGGPTGAPSKETGAEEPSTTDTPDTQLETQSPGRTS
ncbi:PadR family transcriptional regulator [Streptomyces sp. W16]|uniref:PadR family transcriptional regulator n=1 Tax=Streptomyces sp. W16 TaxID=3076631 RepID=UPI00295AB565|nr:PadR family transcriptional regulator [Streptomyces sp. W16]MDV9170980.1 PadR family transcriptional regulator [Streptomyces sp. W16]